MQYYRQKAKQQSFVAVFFFFQIVIQTYSQTLNATPEVELVELICTMLMRPYKYMGRYFPKEGKNRRKVTF